MKIVYVLLSFALLISFSGCDDENAGKEYGSMIIHFDNHVGDEELELNKDYVNSSNETFRVTRLNYYISNIKLTKSDGSEFLVPQDSSYFLIMADMEDSHFAKINNIPAGDYDAISFTIGVDSLRSTMDISKRTGALDPAQGHDGMYWTWNSGYIFFKMEGTSPSAPSEQENKFYYHIGGFGGYDSPTLNNIRETTISLGAPAPVRNNHEHQVHIVVDVQEFFKNPTTIKIAEHSSVMFSEFSRTVSENYTNMFKLGDDQN